MRRKSLFYFYINKPSISFVAYELQMKRGKYLWDEESKVHFESSSTHYNCLFFKTKILMYLRINFSILIPLYSNLRLLNFVNRLTLRKPIPYVSPQNSNLMNQNTPQSFSISSFSSSLLYWKITLKLNTHRIKTGGTKRT